MPGIQKIDDALEQLKEFGTTPEDILGMSPQDYKEFTTSLGWPAYIGPLVKSRLTSTSVPPTWGTQQSTEPTKTSNEVDEIQEVDAEAVNEVDEIRKLEEVITSQEVVAETKTATKLATVKLDEVDEIRKLKERIAAQEAAAEATKLAVGAELEEMRAKCAKLEDDKVGLAAAAAVGAETKALAAVARAEANATFRKITALSYYVSKHRKEVLDFFKTIGAQGTMQVCFVMDATGSMAPQLAAVKENLLSIASAVVGATSIKTQFALVAYRDYEDSKPIEVFNFGGPGELASALRSVVATGGKDQCEDCFGGLATAVGKLDWSTPARVIFWTGDAPQHGSKYNGGAGDSHSGSTVTSSYFASEAAQKNITINFVPMNTSTDIMIAAMQKEFAEHFAVLTVSKSKDFIETVKETLKETATMTCTKLPASLRGPDVHYDIDPLAKFGPERKNTEVLIPQSCPKVRDAHPLDILLVRLPKFATEIRTVRLGIAPFAKGDMRYAFHCQMEATSFFLSWGSGKWVAKCAIRAHSELGVRQMRIQNIARFMAAEFCARTKMFPSPLNCKLEYVPVSLLKMVDNGRVDYWMLEPHIPGQYLKYNNNNGAVINEWLPSNPLPQAFSHFSFEYSAGRLLICDIQGVFEDKRYILTDPAIHTLDPDSLEDDTNMSAKGMAAFFNTHVCNEACSLLGLPKRMDLTDLAVHITSPFPVLGDHSMV